MKMLGCIQKTESVRFIATLLLSVSAQFIICTLLWNFCCSNASLPDRKLNVQLIIPFEAPEEIPIQKSLLKQDEEKIEMIQKLHESEQIIPENPFEQPMKLDKPVIIEKTKPEVKKKQALKQEPVKQVEKLPETKPINPVPEKPKDIQTSLPEPTKAVQETKAPAVTKPVLTKAQQNENTKYLAKVMQILEKNKRYSEAARKRNLEGKIIVAFAITSDGKTEKVKAKTTSPRELADAAEQLIKSAKLPAPPSSWPAGSLVEIPINYKIK